MICSDQHDQGLVPGNIFSFMDKLSTITLNALDVTLTLYTSQDATYRPEVTYWKSGSGAKETRVVIIPVRINVVCTIILHYQLATRGCSGKATDNC